MDFDTEGARACSRSHESWCTYIPYLVLDLYFAVFNRSWPLSLLCYALFALPLEVAFYIHCRRFRLVRSRCPNNAFMGWRDSREARRCWERVLAENSAASIERDLRSWFAGEGELGSEDVAGVMSIFIYNARLEDLKAAQRKVIDSMLELVEAVLGRRLPGGRNPSLRCLASYVFDDLDACNKPLLHYLWLQTIEGIIWWAYRRLGFELRSTSSSPHSAKLQYWYRPPRDGVMSSWRAKGPPPTPIVFLHGVGGLFPYCVFILHFAFRTRAAVLVPLFPQCSLSSMPSVALTPRTPLPAELASAVLEMLGACGARRAAFFAHSFGTAVLAALLKAMPQLAVACTFMDPICFQLHTSAIVSNFLLAEPPLSRKTWVHYAQKAYATRELTLQDAFRRRFWWANHWLSPSDLPCDSLVILAGSDTVADASDVHRQLVDWQQALAADNQRLPPTKRAPRLQVEMHDGYFHGQIIAYVTEQRRIVDHLIGAAAVAEAAAAVSPETALDSPTRYVVAGSSGARAVPHAAGKFNDAIDEDMRMQAMHQMRMVDASVDDDAETASVVSSALASTLSHDSSMGSPAVLSPHSPPEPLRWLASLLSPRRLEGSPVG